ncbi:hypothetical protein [Sanguibacter massiliensis]|nr:hypothetical protein [Sanguibacter massiliensis]
MSDVDDWFIERIVDGDRHRFELEVLDVYESMRLKFLVNTDGTVAFA